MSRDKEFKDLWSKTRCEEYVESYLHKEPQALKETLQFWAGKEAR